MDTKQQTPMRVKRQKLGMSILDVSLRTGIDTGTLSKLERQAWGPDNFGINKSRCQKLAAVLGLSELEILYPERFM